MSQSLAELQHAVAIADSSERLIGAVYALAATADPAAVAPLITVLSYNNPGAAVAAVGGLVRIGEPSVAALLEQLDQHNYTARSWAIRALAEIGDARGLPTLLGAATADFSLSVRRAAAKGLGTLKWHQFSGEMLEIAQAEALDALLFTCDDEEWVVRYATMFSLEKIALTLTQEHPDWLTLIIERLQHVIQQDMELAVRARAQLALFQLQALKLHPSDTSLSASDWQGVLEALYKQKSVERPVAAGDPRRFRDLAADLTPKS